MDLMTATFADKGIAKNIISSIDEYVAHLLT